MRNVSASEKIVRLAQGLFESTEALELLVNYVELNRQTGWFIQRQLRRNLKTLKLYGATGVRTVDVKSRHFCIIQ